MQEIQRTRLSLVGKVRNLYRVYKLIMVSRVPRYGHLEYLEVDIIVDLITLI